MHVLIAFDKFKDALSAPEACAYTAHTIEVVEPDWTLEEAPLTDGGEGFCDILTRSAAGESSFFDVAGPSFEVVDAEMGIVDLDSLPESIKEWLDLPQQGKLAIVEMAQASGLQLLAATNRDAMVTSTYGTGQLFQIAIEMGVDAILMGIGGSATSDLGLGALEALGIYPVDASGEHIAHVVPEKWPQVAGFSGEKLKDLPPIRIACDVDAPLLGVKGAAAIFGPQKGISAAYVPEFDEAAKRIAGLLCEHFSVDKQLVDEPCTGAAGGIGFGFKVASNDVRFVPGFDLVWRWLGLEEKMDRADLVITGEGRYDATSLTGKGPGTLVEAAQKAGKPAWVFAGAVETGLESEDIIAISPENTPLAVCLENSARYLRESVRQRLESGGVHIEKD